MDYRFTFRDRIEGAIITEIDGTAVISEHPKGGWQIAAIRVDGMIENPRFKPDQPGIIPQPAYLQCEVELPDRHPLASRIMIELLQPTGWYWREIDRAWAAANREVA